MRTIRSGSTEPAPSRFTLGRLPGRVVVFLQAVARYPALRAALAEGGYRRSDHEEGQRLLATVCDYGVSVEREDDDAAARAASDEIERWIGTHLARLKLAIARVHPEMPSPLDAIEPRQGEALLALATLLDRLDTLEHGAGDTAGVVGTLARRGLDAAARARLRALLACAQVVQVPAVSPAPDARAPELLALYRWHADWSATARALVRRKDWLIALGLSARRREAGQGEEERESAD